MIHSDVREDVIASVSVAVVYMVSITLPRKKGADIVTALETVRKPTAAVVDTK